MLKNFCDHCNDKMEGIFENWHLPPNAGTLLLLVIGILLQMADGSPFSLKAKWKLVWTTEIPSEFFSLLVQKIIKSMLSVIVVIRCTTTYAYVVSAMLVLFCISKESSPKLMLLWLFVSGIKSVCMTFSEAIIGVYVCSAFKEIHKACVEFFISKALELIFAAYLWGNVLNIYQEMERKAANNTTKPQTKEQMLHQKTECVRQRARSLVDESTLYKTARLNNFEFRDVPQIILQMFRRGDEMSQDSLLSSGMMLASVSNLGSFDDLKITHSLGELGIVNLETTEVFGMDEDETSTPQEKALKFLKLTHSDVLTIKLNRIPITNDIYAIDSDTWESVAASRHDMNKPKKARTQVFIHEYTPLDVRCDSANVRNIIKRETYRFNFSSSIFLNRVESAIDEDQDDDLFDDSRSVIEEEEFFRQEENTETNKKWVQLFMSNRKEGRVFTATPFGLRLKKFKKNTFAELCNQVSMNMIGSEVFDRAPKLLRITSISVLNQKKVTRSSTSLAAVSALQKARQEKNEEQNKGSKDVYFVSAPEPPSRENVRNNQGTDSVEEETRKGFLSQGSNNQKDNKKVGSHKNKQVNSSNFSLNVNIGYHEESQEEPIYSSSGVVLKRTGKKRGRTKLRNESEHSQNHSSSDISAKDSTSSQNPSSSDSLIKQSSEEAENPHSSEETNGSGKNPKKMFKRQIYFLTELFKKPFSDVLEIYQNLKEEVNKKKEVGGLRRQEKEFLNFPHQNDQLKRYGRRFKSHGSKPKGSKIWKSKVLNTVELLNKKSTKSVLRVIKTQSLVTKLRDNISLHSKNSSTSQIEVKYWINSNLESSGSFDISTSDGSITPEQESRVTLAECEWEMSKIQKTSNSTESWKSKAAKGHEFISTRSNSNRQSLITITNRDKEIQKLDPEEGSSVAASVTRNEPEGTSVIKQESEESISLYYSQAASLASPLFDMKRFIYPDHIHYSYKHVKKKGFDVNINRGFPLLVRGNVAAGKPVPKGNKLIQKKPEITKRPMDLSFAMTDAFTQWQNSEQVDVDAVSSEKHVNIRTNTSKRNKECYDVDLNKNRKSERLKKNRDGNDGHSSIQCHTNPKSRERNSNTMKYFRSARDCLLIEKLLKLQKRFNNNECEATSTERRTEQISSTQLHLNKERTNSCTPVISLQQNKTSDEKKKTESHTERTWLVRQVRQGGFFPKQNSPR